MKVRLPARTACLLALTGAAAGLARQDAGYHARIQAERDQRAARLRDGDFSPLKKLRVLPLASSARITVGSGAEADIRIEGAGIAPVHFIIEGMSATPVLKAGGGRMPPCNFSPLYSCPFPRKQNRLTTAVRAGEKWYRESK